jgi:hypothetical protein
VAVSAARAARATVSGDGRMDLVVELVTVVVVKIALAPERIVRTPVVLNQEESVLSRFGMLEETPLNILVRSPDIPRDTLSVRKNVDAGPASPRVPSNRDVPQGPPSGHCLGRTEVYLSYIDLIY